MMVCGYDDARVLLVMQVDHSRLAGELAAHWGNDEFASLKPYTSMVQAVQEHDSGWWGWEIKPTLNSQGYPPDYLERIDEEWLGFQGQGVDRMAERDPYAGIIVSMHISGLLSKGMGLFPYMPDFSADPHVKKFLGEQEILREQLLQDLRSSDCEQDEINEDYLWNNFKLMEVYDQMAQFVCNRHPFNSDKRKNGPTHRLSNAPVPVAVGQEDVRITVDVQDETSAVVQPYPFDLDPLVLTFPGRLVPKGPYASNEDFLAHFYKAERVTITRILHT